MTAVLQLSEKLRLAGAALYLGRYQGRPVFGSREDHLLALGPTRCGKTSGLIVPSVAVHPGPAVVVSTRDDIVVATASARRTIAAAHGGLLREVALGGCTSGQLAASAWSITDGCRDWNVALERAEVLATTAIPEAKDQFWRGAATDVLAGSLLGASLLGEDDRRLARRIRSANISQYHAVVHGSYPSDHDAPYVFAGVSDPKAMAEDTRRSVYAVVSSQILGPFRYEYSTGTRGFIDLHDFVRSWGTLYVTIPWERAESLQPLVAAFVEAVVSAWRRMRPSDGRTLLLALDEVANVAPLPNLPKMITAGAGDGIQCVLGMQEPGQASRWGSEADVVTGGPPQLAIYPGLRTDFLNRIVGLAPQQVQYELQVTVAEDTPRGLGYADEDRLIRERLDLEAELAHVKPRLRRAASKRAGRRLAAARLHEGVRNRLEDLELDESGPISAVLGEITTFTTVRQVPERRPTLEVDDLARGLPGHFYLVSRGLGQRRAFQHWAADPLWSEVLTNAGTRGQQ